MRAYALVSKTHQDAFEEVCVEAIDTAQAIIMFNAILRVRLRDPRDDGVVLLAMPGDLAQRCRVGPGSFVFQPERSAEVRAQLSQLGIRASFVPSAVYSLDLRDPGLLDALRAVLLRRAPTFGPTYPRIAVA